MNEELILNQISNLTEKMNTYIIQSTKNQDEIKTTVNGIKEQVTIANGRTLKLELQHQATIEHFQQCKVNEVEKAVDFLKDVIAPIKVDVNNLKENEISHKNSIEFINFFYTRPKLTTALIVLIITVISITGVDAIVKLIK